MSMDVDELRTPPRSEIPVERTWNAESVFAAVADWEAEVEAIAADLPSLQAYEGRLGDGADSTIAALAAREDLDRRIGPVFLYASIGQSVETTNPDAVARSGRARALYAQMAAAAAFVEPELLAIGHERLLEWTNDHPELLPYGHYFDDLFRRGEHVRSAEVEELLGLVSDAHSGTYAVYTSLADGDLTFRPATGESGETIDVTQGSIRGLLGSPDRALRRSAYESYADGYRAFRNVFAASYATAIKQDVFSARARRHASTCAAALHRSNIPVEVLDNLLATFQRNLPTWHRYWQVRRALLGVDSLRPYDLWAPFGGTRPRFTYEQSVDWICESLAPLGEEYVATVRRGCLEERWVDVYPNHGKRGGAFSAGAPGTYPFIVMSFDGSAGALGTLAHELGHSMHSYLSWKTQPHVSARYVTFAAEVASNFHQALLRAYLLESVADRELQLAVLDEAMGNFLRYFFIMPTLARIEREAHERVERGEGMTADVLEELTAGFFGEAYGQELDFERERVGITWAEFLHLYRPFYVFQYATGISGAHALARGVLDGETGAVERYLGFLRAGGSEYPLDALRAAGVDLTSPLPVEETFAVLSSFVDRLEALAA